MPGGSVVFHFRFVGDAGQLPENSILEAMFDVADLLRHSRLVSGSSLVVKVIVRDQKIRVKPDSLIVSFNAVGDSITLVELSVRGWVRNDDPF